MNARDFLSLGRTQRRLSDGYRAWAREDRTAGNMTRAARWYAQADRLRTEGNFHVRCARMLVDRTAA